MAGQTPVAPLNYSSPALNSSYRSEWERADTAFDGSAMAMTDLFLDSVLKEDVLPQSVAEALDFDDLSAFFDALLEDLDEVVANNWRILLCIIVGAIIAVLIPVAGCVWCCCCKAKESDGKTTKGEDKVVFYVLAGFLTVLWVLCLLVMLWYVGADIYASVQVNQFGQAYDALTYDFSLFINNTVQQIEYLTSDNYNEFSAQLDGTLDAAVSELDSFIQADVVGGTVNLNHLSAVYNDTVAAADLYRDPNGATGSKADIEDKTGLYQSAAQALETAVDSLKSSSALTSLLSAADASGYDTAPVRAALDALAVDVAAAAAAQLPVLALTAAAEAEIRGKADVLGAALYDISAFPETFRTQYVATLTSEIEALGQEIQETADLVVSEVEKFSLAYDPDDADEVDDTLNPWDDLFFALLLIPFVLIALILIFYAVGFGCGLFSSPGAKRRVHGSSWINAGTWILVISGFLMWGMTVVLFILGALGQKLVCDTLEYPEDSELYDALERNVNQEIQEVLNNTDFSNVTWSLPELLEDCSRDTGIYTALKLDEVYGEDLEAISDWTQTYDVAGVTAVLLADVDHALDSVVAALRVGTADDGNVREASAALEVVEEAVVLIVVDAAAVFSAADWQAFKDLYGQVLTGASGLDQDDITAVDAAIQDVDDAESALIAAARDASTSVDALKLALYLDDSATKSLSQSLYDSTDELSAGADYLGEGGAGRDELDGVVNRVVADIVVLTQGFVQFSLDTIEVEMGRCRPAYDVYYGMVNAVCWRAVDPYNWTWAGLGLLLLLLLPMLCIAIWMANLMKRRPEDMLPVAKDLDASKTRKPQAPKKSPTPAPTPKPREVSKKPANPSADATKYPVAASWPKFSSTHLHPPDPTHPPRCPCHTHFKVQDRTERKTRQFIRQPNQTKPQPNKPKPQPNKLKPLPIKPKPMPREQRRVQIRGPVDSKFRESTLRTGPKTTSRPPARMKKRVKRRGRPAVPAVIAATTNPMYDNQNPVYHKEYPRSTTTAFSDEPATPTTTLVPAATAFSASSTGLNEFLDEKPALKSPYNPSAFSPDYAGQTAFDADSGVYDPSGFSEEYAAGNRDKVMDRALPVYEPAEYDDAYAPKRPHYDNASQYSIPDFYTKPPKS